MNDTKIKFRSGDAVINPHEETLSVNRHSKNRLDSRVAMPIEALSEADLDRLEQSKIPEETKKLDHLVPEKWQTALDPTKPASANVR
jgi:hypothetical protein